MKHIKIARRGNKIRIIKQTNREDEFSSPTPGEEYNHVFQSKSGFILCSLFSPATTKSQYGYREGDISHKGNEYPGLFVRGSMRENDYNIMKIPYEEWLDQLRVAVREYNEAFKDS